MGVAGAISEGQQTFYTDDSEPQFTTTMSENQADSELQENAYPYPWPIDSTTIPEPPAAGTPSFTLVTLLYDTQLTLFSLIKKEVAPVVEEPEKRIYFPEEEALPDDDSFLLEAALAWEQKQANGGTAGPEPQQQPQQPAEGELEYQFEDSNFENWAEVDSVESEVVLGEERDGREEAVEEAKEPEEGVTTQTPKEVEIVDDSFFGLPTAVSEIYGSRTHPVPSMALQIPHLPSLPIGGVTKLYDWQVDCLTQPGFLEGQNLVYALPTSG